MIRRYLILGGAHLLASAGGFLITWLIADRFGAAGLGDVALALALAEYALLAAALGMPMYAVTRIAAAPATAGRWAGRVVVARLLTGCAAYGLLIAVLATVPRFAALRGLGAVLGLTLFAAALNTTFVAQALGRTVVLASINVATQTLFLVTLWLTLRWHPQTVAVGWSKVTADFLVAGALLLWLRRRVGALHRPAGGGEIAWLLRTAMPIGGSNLLRHMTHASDVLIVGLLVTRADLGHFAASARLAAFMGAFGGPYFVLLLPRLTAARARGDLRVALAAAQRHALPIAATVAALLALLARPLLATAFADSYAAAGAPALRWLALAFFFGFAGRQYRQVLVVRGRQRTDLAATLAAAGVHVAAKLALIPTLGITGAAIGTATGNAVLLAALAYAARGALTESESEPNAEKA